METGLIRIGVYVDGGYFQQIDTHYRDHHPRAAGIRPGGLMAWCRDQVARRTGKSLSVCRVVEAWCFVGGGGEGPNERTFRKDGFMTHEVGGGVRGVEVALSVEALSRAAQGLDAVVLVVSSTSYVPLARKLAAAGAAVMIPGFQLQVPDRKGGVRRQWTSSLLLEEAAWPVVLSRVIDDAEERDPLIRGLFMGSGKARETTRKEARPPVGGPSGPTSQPDSGLPPEGRLQGRIADLRERMGFIVEDWNGKRLFFHHSAAVDGTFLDLEVGERVEYDRGVDPKNRAAATAVRKVQAEAAPEVEAAPETEESEAPRARPIIGTPTEPEMEAVTKVTDLAIEIPVISEPEPEPEPDPDPDPDPDPEPTS